MRPYQAVFAAIRESGAAAALEAAERARSIRADAWEALDELSRQQEAEVQELRGTLRAMERQRRGDLSCWDISLLVTSARELLARSLTDAENGRCRWIHRAGAGADGLHPELPPADR